MVSSSCTSSSFYVSLVLKCLWVGVFCVVSRIEGRSERLEMLMQLDVNTEIYPIKKEDKYALLITPTLHADGTGDSGYYGQVIISLSLFLSSSCRNNPSAKQMSLVAGHRRSIYT